MYTLRIIQEYLYWRDLSGMKVKCGVWVYFLLVVIERDLFELAFKDFCFL